MPPGPGKTPTGSGADLQGFSCLTCRQRKVKCDRRAPCSNCVKADRQCSFIPPTRGKRKRTKRLKEGLHAKLRRYEELLKSYGAKLEEPSQDDDLSDAHATDSDSDATSQPDVEMANDGAPTRSRGGKDLFGLEDMKPVLVAKEGVSIYFDGPLLNLRSGEQPDATNMDGLEDDAITDAANVEEADILFSSAEQHGPPPDINSPSESPASLQLPVHMFPKLQEIFTDRLDPLMKILHLPTFWPKVTDVLHNPQSAPKDLNALVSSFYFATVSTLEEDECLTLLGTRKSLLDARCRLAARQALVGAKFLSTSSLRTLQAFMLFMVGVRDRYRTDTLYVLSGVAVRLARKMGLHRDGSSLRLSPFESEMRRRLWWHLVHFDYRMADHMSARQSMDLFLSDTRFPLNIADEDFHPDMSELPPERNGITTVTICLLRCEITDFLRKFSTPLSHDMRWGLSSSAELTFAQKDTLIGELEDQWERKFLRYFDPSNSLHNLTTIMVRSCLCKIRLIAYNPRTFADRLGKIPQRERDIVFANTVKLLEYSTLIPDNPALKKYTWQVGAFHTWNTLLYVLIEARHRKTGPDVDRLWHMIGAMLSKYPKMFDVSTSTLYTALRKWTLEGWDDYLVALREAKMPEPATPDYISAMRRCLAVKPAVPTTEPVQPEASKNTEMDTSKNVFQGTLDNGGGLRADFEPFESYDFSNLLSFDTNPSEWLQWERLLAEEGGNFSIGLE